MVLDIKGVTKTFSRRGKNHIVANDDISLSLNEGEVFGLLGQNGSGKTTLVNQILGMLTPDHGDIHLLGESVRQSPARARTICSVQPQSQVPLGTLTPKRAVTLIGKMRAGKAFDSKRVNMLFEALDMGDWAHTVGERLSGGAMRLTAFCMAVIVPGQLVILDEPTNDVDPVRRRYLWDVIRKLIKDGTSVILVTHNVLEAEKVVDRLAIINEGKILTQGTPSDVKGAVSDHMRMELSLANDSAVIDVPGWALSSRQNGSRFIFSMEPCDVSSAIEWARKQVDSGLIMDYSLSPTTIEDAYIELTSGKAVQHS